jgi:CRISPR-associated protein Cas1
MDLIVNRYGTRIRSRGERIRLVLPRTSKAKEYAARRLEKILILRPSSISTGAVALALEHDIDIVYLGAFGKPVGRLFPSTPRGLVALRRAQLAVANSSRAFTIARELVRAKTGNQIAHLRHLASERNRDFSTVTLRLAALLESLDLIPDSPTGREQLFGVEGYVADRYFAALRSLYPFPGRRPQGRDKFNSALNYGYGILYNEVERACLYVGLDPYLGLYHAERYGKPALVLDLVEEFRVPLVDSTVFPLFLDRQLDRPSNYRVVSPGEYLLSADGKRCIVEAVYQRLNQSVRWQGKRQTMKRVVEEQLRHLARVFLDREEMYRPFSYTAVVKEGD